MTALPRALRILLIILVAFLAITAIPGGFALLVGAYAPPTSMLKGTVFSDFTIPALTLIVIIGGGASLATVLLLRRSRFSLLAACLAGAALLSFEFVQVLVIGSPAGPARFMQVLYFALGLALVAIAPVLMHLAVVSQAAAGTLQQDRRQLAPRPSQTRRPTDR